MNARTAIVILGMFVSITNATVSAQSRNAVSFLPEVVDTTKYSYPPGGGVTIPEFVPVDKEPQIIKQALPVYPEIAQQGRIEGKVFVKVLVDGQGKPIQASVAAFNLRPEDATAQAQSSIENVSILSHGVRVSEKIFNQPSIDAAMQFRFTPAMANSKPVAVWVVIPFTFRLKEDSTSDWLHLDFSHMLENFRTDSMLAEECKKVSEVTARWRSYADSLAKIASKYNDSTYQKALKEYYKSIPLYEKSLRESRNSILEAEKMIRQAKEMLKKMEKEQENEK
jgi:hypothetical protein